MWISLNLLKSTFIPVNIQHIEGEYNRAGEKEEPTVTVEIIQTVCTVALI